MASKEILVLHAGTNSPASANILIHNDDNVEDEEEEAAAFSSFARQQSPGEAAGPAAAAAAAAAGNVQQQDTSSATTTATTRTDYDNDCSINHPGGLSLLPSTDDDIIIIDSTVETGAESGDMDMTNKSNNDNDNDDENGRATTNQDSTATQMKTPASCKTTGARNTPKNKKSSSTTSSSTSNAGSKKGGKRQDRPQSFWFRLCQRFESGHYKSQIEFLRSRDSGPEVNDSHRMHFSRAYKKYLAGNLANCEQTRTRKRKYEPLEKRVIAYWQAQQQQKQQQQKGMIMREQQPANEQAAEQVEERKDQMGDSEAAQAAEDAAEVGKVLGGPAAALAMPAMEAGDATFYDPYPQPQPQHQQQQMIDDDFAPVPIHHTHHQKQPHQELTTLQQLPPPPPQQRQPNTVINQDNNQPDNLLVEQWHVNRQQPQHQHPPSSMPPPTKKQRTHSAVATATNAGTNHVGQPTSATTTTGNLHSTTTHSPHVVVAWSHLQQKAKEWAQEMGLDDDGSFQASSGWIDNVLKRHAKEVAAAKARKRQAAAAAASTGTSVADGDDDDDDGGLVFLGNTSTTSNSNSSSGALPSLSLQKQQRQAAAALMALQVQRADQEALLQRKQLKVGDRVTVLDMLQQPQLPASLGGGGGGQPPHGQKQQLKLGDLVVARIHLPNNRRGTEGLNAGTITTAEPARKTSRGRRRNKKAAASARQDEENTDGNTEEQVSYLVVERRRHGMAQSFRIQDVRTVVKHVPFEEDTLTMQRLLQPGLHDGVFDSFSMAMAHFCDSCFALPRASRVLRPLWEEEQPSPQNGNINATNGTIVHSHSSSSTTVLRYSDTSCAEKINLHALRSHILPMFRRDQKNRQKTIRELESLSQRTKFQQEVLEKLRYAQKAHDMANDLKEMLRSFSTREKTAVYQVDYEALDVSLRGRLIARNPAPLSEDSFSKSYAPRSLTLQAMPKDLRNALVGSFAHWITSDGRDNESYMVVSVLCSLAAMAQSSSLVPSWLEYRQHASSWHTLIQQVHSGVSASQAQLLPCILVHGGTYEIWKQAMDEQTKISLPPANDDDLMTMEAFVLRLMTEWRALRDAILGLPQYAWTQLESDALLASGSCAPATIPSASFVRILQASEREIWTNVSHNARTQGWTVCANLIDGILVECPSRGEQLANILNLAENDLKSRGWDIRLIEGPCHGLHSGTHHREPLPLLQEARQAVGDLQQIAPKEQGVHQRWGDTSNAEERREPMVDTGAGHTAKAPEHNDGTGNANELDPAAAGTELHIRSNLNSFYL